MKRNVWLEKLPFFFYIVPIAWITYSLNARVPMHNAGEAVLIWIWTFAFYLRKFIFPQNLIPLYDLPQPVSAGDVEYLLSFMIFFVFWISVGYCLYARKGRWYVFAAFYYFFSIFFLLRFDFTVDTTLVADRFMYLPSLGFCWGIGYWAQGMFAGSFSQHRWSKCLVGGGIIAILAIFSVQTFSLCRLWRNDQTLWQHTIQINPKITVGYNNLASYYLKKQDLKNALENYNKAIELSPDFYIPYGNRGAIYQYEGKFDLAMADYDKSIALKPDFSAYNNRGALHNALRQYDLAIADYTKSIEIQPVTESYFNRAAIHAFRGEWDLALADYTQAIKINPKDIDSLLQRAGIYMAQKEFDRARADYDTILRFQPENQQAREGQRAIENLKGK